jgi:RNA polymerase sigma factor (sigma-70 family)
MVADSTHPSLFSRIRKSDDPAAWREFDTRYGELILRYCLARGLQYADAEDVRQGVLLSLSKSLPQYCHDPARGRFRTYLGQIVRHAIARHLQRRRPDSAPGGLSLDEHVAGSAGLDGADLTWNQEWVGHHYRMAMRTIRAICEPRTVHVFERLIAGDSVQQVAEQFGMTEQAVHKIKQRIRDRARELILRQISDEDDRDDQPR